MKIATAEYVIREAFISLKRNNWMTAASIGTVTVSLFILGLFLIILLNLNRMAFNIESQVQISVYLSDEMTGTATKNLQEEIESMQGIKTVTFVGKAEALSRFKERLGDQQFLLEALGDANPLPNSFEVTVNDPAMVKTAAEVIGKKNGVEDAKYGQDVIEHLFDITRIIRICGVGILLVLALSALFIISNTIRLTVFARRREILIMKYVGATDWFIRWPFLIEGMAMGLFGGLLAALILNSAYGMVTAKIYSMLAFFPLIPAYPFLYYISIVLLISGMLIGALGSAFSLKRFLKA